MMMLPRLRPKASRFVQQFTRFACIGLTAFVLLVCAPLLDILPERRAVNTPPPPADVPVSPKAAPAEPQRIATRLRPGETLLGLLTRHGLQPPSAHKLLAKLRPLMNPRKLRAGDNVELVLDPSDKSVQGMDVVIEDQMIRVTTTNEGWLAERKQIPSLREPHAIRGTIESSFYESGTGAGLTPQQVLDLARILEYDIDFFSDFRRGNAFGIVVEEVRYADGRRAPGEILAAELEVDDETSRVFRFVPKDGRAAYYDYEGRTLRRSFLRAPLSYARISSHFTLRRHHPIFRTVRPHRAIDYAAPAGTPVVAIGNGRVEFSGWRDGYGNLVEIRHGNGYTSRYGHFSRIARGIRKGAQVNAGDIIGYVGQTGHATGPHLHFEFLRGSEKINFLGVKLPRVERLTGTDLQRFIETRDQTLALLRLKTS